MWASTNHEWNIIHARLWIFMNELQPSQSSAKLIERKIYKLIFLLHLLHETINPLTPTARKFDVEHYEFNGWCDATVILEARRSCFDACVHTVYSFAVDLFTKLLRSSGGNSTGMSNRLDIGPLAIVQAFQFELINLSDEIEIVWTFSPHRTISFGWSCSAVDLIQCESGN